MSRRSSISTRLALTVGAAAFVVIAPGWTGPTWASSPPGHANYQAAHAPRGETVSGTWSGSYSGSFTGTFKLTWKEAKSKLSGTIAISGFGNVPTSINGSLKGASIKFGTVGSESITYSGSVAGSSMSGSWKMRAGGRAVGTGSWKASKSS